MKTGFGTAESHFRVTVRALSLVKCWQNEGSTFSDFGGGFGVSGGVCGVAERLQIGGGLPADGRTHENARGGPRQGVHVVF